MGLFLENILLALFKSFRLNQLAVHGRRWFGFLVGGDLSFRVECSNQQGPDLVLTISALDANDNVVKEQTFENIPITRNQITRYNGNFFSGGGGNAPASGSAFRMTANPDWDKEQGYEF